MRRLILLLGGVLLLSSVAVAQDAPPDTTEAPAPEPLRLKIWWPDVLVAEDNEALIQALDAQIEGFVSSESNVIVESRLKQVGTTGGIMSTLASASNVAPAALPTLTLIRRQDLLMAERDGLIQSIDGLIPSAIQGDLNRVLPLGQVNGELYGLPYMLDLQHIVYRTPSGEAYDDWSYEAVLERQQPFVFAAGRANGLSDVFLLQYLSAGGELDDDGSLTFNPSALRTTLRFYEQASDSGLIDGFALNYAAQTDYLTNFQDGLIDNAVFSSSTYLALHENDPSLRIAPIPTPDGRMTSLLDGWMWVLVATEPEQQEAATRFVVWMMNAQRQASIARLSYRLPSQQSAFQFELAGNADASSYLELLENPVFPISESEGGTLARAMQEAFSSVLTTASTADEATDLVAEQQTQ